MTSNNGALHVSITSTPPHPLFSSPFLPVSSAYLHGLARWLPAPEPEYSMLCLRSCGLLLLGEEEEEEEEAGPSSADHILFHLMDAEAEDNEQML